MGKRLDVMKALASVDLPPMRRPTLGQYLRFVWDAVTGSRILYRKRARRRGWVER